VTTPANDLGASPAGPATGSIGPVIDLRDGPTTRVRLPRDDNPFTALAPPERMRLIIRVLCELVAYDELDAAEERRRTIRAAMDASERSAPRPGLHPDAAPGPAAAPGSSAPTSVTG
jgi:hypothetical protein